MEQTPLLWSLMSLIFLGRGRGMGAEICRLILGFSYRRLVWLSQETSREPQRHKLPSQGRIAAFLKEHEVRVWSLWVNESASIG